MASLDEEMLRDAQEDAQEADYIFTQLPIEQKERLSKEDILRLMDVIVEYYFESGLLETDSEEVEIDLEQVAEDVCAKAAKDGIGDYNPEDVFFVVQADLDYQEEHL